jgi:hypothetical protein
MISKLLFLLVVLLNYDLFSQFNTSSSFLIDSSYSTSIEKPVLVLSGQTVNFEADSIYLVNKPRFILYEDIRHKLMNLDFACEPSISLYKESLHQNILLADKLLDNSANTQKLNNEIFTETKLLLDQNKTTFKQTISNLEAAQNNLNLAHDELSNIRTSNFLENILYGTAGIGVGIVIGAILK